MRYPPISRPTAAASGGRMGWTGDVLSRLPAYRTRPTVRFRAFR